MAKSLYHWVALSMAPGVGCVLFKRLVEAFGSPAAVFQAPAKALEVVEGVGPKAARAIRNFDWSDRVNRELEHMKEIGGNWITWEDDAYPVNLKNIYDPPPLLYVRGSLLPQDQTAVAVVGSRNPTQYGKGAAERIGRGLAQAGVTVVSGLARGVDSFAHRGTLSGGGRTLAVLGCGLDVVYPPENEDLYEQVASQGAVISEFPLGTRPEGDHFPIRNRIISGLSLGVVVVEATIRSGSLITARFALDQGRDVFALPGNVDSRRSEGTNELIKQGAKLVIRLEDILEEIPRVQLDSLPEKPPAPKLSEEEARVFSILSHEALHIDQIIVRSELSSARTSATLLSLELAGHIKQLPGMRFVRG
jgi:DNA processing protein